MNSGRCVSMLHQKTSQRMLSSCTSRSCRLKCRDSWSILWKRCKFYFVGIYSMETWICTKCWEPAEKPEFTLCKKHYDLWKETDDYTNLVNIDSPPEVREYYNIGQIYYNRWMCPDCKDIIYSTNKHDYKKCSCWKCFIDGGSWYMRCNPDLINMAVSFNIKDNF